MRSTSKPIIAAMLAMMILFATPALAGKEAPQAEEKASQAGEKAPQGDPRIKKLLDQTEIKYMVDEDGDYQMLNHFDDDRTQIVFIFSNTSKLGSMEIREIWSVGYLSDKPMPLSVARNLLRENSRVKLGAWELGQLSGKDAGVFSAKIAAETDLDTLIMTLHAVSETADEKEKELLGNDEL